MAEVVTGYASACANFATEEEMPYEPQLRYRQRMVETGRCANCGKPRDGSHSKNYCLRCLDKARRVNKRILKILRETYVKYYVEHPEIEPPILRDKVEEARRASASG
jgi:hypothetical protein